MKYSVNNQPVSETEFVNFYKKVNTLESVLSGNENFTKKERVTKTTYNKGYYNGFGRRVFGVRINTKSSMDITYPNSIMKVYWKSDSKTRMFNS